MYFLLVSLIYITAAQLSVKGVTERGFFIQFENAKQILGDRVQWVAHLPSERLSIKELMNGVTSLGEGCSGRVTTKQLRTNSKFEVQCALQFGKQYTLEAVITKTGEDAQILSADFDFSNQRRRRLLDTPSASPVTAAPTTSPVVSTMPSRAPVTRAPTSDGVVTNPSASPSAIPTSLPSKVPTINSDTTTQSTTGSITTQIMSTSIAPVSTSVLMDLTFSGLTDETFLESKSTIRRVVADAAGVHISQVAVVLKADSIVEATITTDEPNVVVQNLESLASNELQDNFTDEAEDAGITGVSLQEVSAPVVVKHDSDDGGSTFAGFDLSSGGDIALFVFVIFLLLAVLALILGGPYLYRRYYETFGTKSINATSSPKAAAKLSEIWEETIGSATKKLSELSGKLGSSFISESKIEIAPIKSEDRIRMMDPVE